MNALFKTRWSGRGAPRNPGTTLLLIASLATLATGCATRVREVPADYWVRTVRAGETFTAPVDGKFVPNAMFDELLGAYIRESFRRQP